MSQNDSRTTRKARTILPEDGVSIAIPAVALHADGEPLESEAGKTVKALFTRSLKAQPDPTAKVLAFTADGTAVMDTRASNAGIPNALIARTTEFPSVLEQDEDGLVVELAGAKYRIGRIHKSTMLSAIDRVAVSEVADSDIAEPHVAEPHVAEPHVAEPHVIDEQTPEAEVAADKLAESDDLEVHKETPAISEEIEETEEAEEIEDAVDLDPPEEEASPAGQTNDVVEDNDLEHNDLEDAIATAPPEQPAEASPKPAHTSVVAGAKASALSWTESFEKALFDETPSAPIETRSRPTIQCQRLLRGQHVYLAVPGAAQPRKGTDDPKGDFLVAFTDSGVILFKPSRGNKALPRDVIGPIDSEPQHFEPADYSERAGGLLTVGGRQYIVPRAYVRSLTAYLNENRS